MVGEIILLSVVFAGLCFGIRGFIRGSSHSPRARGSRLVTCTVTKGHGLVEVAVGAMSREGFPVLDRFRIGTCSNWPMHQDCGQGCLKQLEARRAV
jgi:hypothetical protein